MPRAAIGNLKVHYQQVGQGPDLILIHGLCCNLAFWYFTIVPKLAERFRVTVYDLRGHGLTQDTPRGYRAVDLAEDLNALLGHLRIRSAHIVGHSFGGAVALALSIRHPAKVRSITFADAWIPTLQPAPLAGNRRQWRKLQMQLKRNGIEIDYEMPRVAQGFIEEMAGLNEFVSSDSRTAPQAFNTLFGNGKDSQTLRRWRKLVRMTAAVEEMSDGTGISRDEIGQVTQPATIIFGRQSRYLPTMQGLKRTLPNSNSRIVPDAGHFFPILKPQLFTETVSDFATLQDLRLKRSAAARLTSKRISGGGDSAR